jgi:hypothetical protein
VHVELKQDHFGVASPGFDVNETSMSWVSNLRKISDWVEFIVMHTARALIHSAFPDTINWTISSSETRHLEMDSNLIREVYMLNRNTEATPEHYNSNLTPLMVFVQAPWVLSPKDFNLLTSRRTVSDMWLK